MKTLCEIKEELKDAENKISGLKDEISQKQKELLALKESNINLTINSAGKQRKPASLNVQTEKIRNLEIEIGQTAVAIERLEEFRISLNEALYITELRDDLQECYFRKSDIFFKKVSEVRHSIKDIVSLSERLSTLINEFNELPNPLLSGLYQVLSKVKTREQFESLPFDWAQEKAKYNITRELLDDEKKIKEAFKKIKSFSDTFYSIDTVPGSLLSALESLMPKDKYITYSGKINIKGYLSGANERVVREMENHERLG